MKGHIEWMITRVAVPLGGLFGVLYEEFHGSVDPELLLLYAAMMGLGVVPIAEKVSAKLRENK